MPDPNPPAPASGAPAATDDTSAPRPGQSTDAPEHGETVLTPPLGGSGPDMGPSAAHDRAAAERAKYPFLGPPWGGHPGDLGTLGPFRVEALLGEGGMGYVFRGFDPVLERPVALKVIRDDRGPVTAGDRGRFLRECRVAAGLNSEHVVTIFSSGEHDAGPGDRVPYLAMELLAGVPLNKWLRPDKDAPQKRVPAADAVRVAADVLRGLAAAHARGLIHRDVKPANAWVEGGPGPAGSVEPVRRVKVLDFGLARRVDSDITRVGAVVGTPSYMAPEQTEGRELDPRADVWAAGVMLYEMLSGGNPFRKDTHLNSMYAVRFFDPPPLAEVPGVPAGLAAFVSRLLSKDPSGRPADARAALAELEQAASGAAPAPGPGAAGPSSPLIGRRALLDEVLGHARAGGVVALWGEGGMGKTALARAAERALRAESGAAAWVDCQSAQRFDECLRVAAAAVLGDRCEAEPLAELGPRLARHLAARRAVLVLDNLETVLNRSADERDAATAWLDAIRPPARVLVTTRLDVECGRRVEVRELDPADAAALFRARAAERKVADPGDDVVGALCELVGRHPLAVELLAHRSAKLPPDQLLKAVARDLGRLAADKRIRACYAETFDRLSEPARRLLARMSVLPAPFGADLLTAAAGDGWDEAAVELTDAALWRLTGARYAVHPLVRQFALDALGAGRAAAEGEMARAVVGAAKKMREALRQVRPTDTRGAGPADSHAAGARAVPGSADERSLTRQYLARCEAELPNLMALAAGARARGEHATVVELAQALSAFWSARGYWDVAYQFYADAVESAVTLGDHGAAAWCCEYHGFICRHLGRFAEAEEAYLSALDLCAKYPAADRHYARVAARYGKLCSVNGNRNDEAIGWLNRARDRFRAGADADGDAMTTAYLGQAHKFAGRLDEATALFAAAIAQAVATGDKHRECESRFQLGNTHLRAGRLAAAEAEYRRSLDLARKADDRVRESQNLIDLGIVATHRAAAGPDPAAQFDAAERLLNDGLRIIRQLGLRMYEGRALRRIAELYDARGDLARALEYADGAVDILHASEDHWARDRAYEVRDALRRKLAAPA